MCDYLYELGEDHFNGKITDIEFVQLTMHYRNFLRKDLRLEMFVPCDDNGKPLGDFLMTQLDYRRAEMKVLFHGFTLEGKVLMHTDYEYTIDLDTNGTLTIDEGDYMLCDVESFCYRDVILTESGIKEIK